MKKLIEYLKNVKVELSKVTWPTAEEVKYSTLLVILFSMFFMVLILVFDLSLNWFTGQLLKL
ncbi:MAG: preprotein translocase subunit SecE [Chitinivibrionales bacterium]